MCSAFGVWFPLVAQPLRFFLCGRGLVTCVLHRARTRTRACACARACCACIPCNGRLEKAPRALTSKNCWASQCFPPATCSEERSRRGVRLVRRTMLHHPTTVRFNSAGWCCKRGSRSFFPHLGIFSFFFPLALFALSPLCPASNPCTRCFDRVADLGEPSYESITS